MFPKTTLLLTLVAIGCSERSASEVRPCTNVPPATSNVIVDEVLCLAERFDGVEEARPADTFMGNSRLRAVLRHPESSPTLAGLGGGGIVDLATWTDGDVLHEVVPLINGSWLDVTSFERLPRGVRIGGITRTLPDMSSTSNGEQASVEWLVNPDEPKLHISGATGLWLHPKGPATVIQNTILVGNTLIAHDGTHVDDLGGAFRIEGVSWISIEDAQSAWRTLEPNAVETKITVGAKGLLFALNAEDDPVAVIPLESGENSIALPPSTTTVIAQADGFSPSVARSPMPELSIDYGPYGAILLSPVSRDGLASPIWAEWTDSLGVAQAQWVGAHGGTLLTGAGRFELTLRSGADSEARNLTVEVPANSEIELRPEFRKWLSSSDYTLMSFELKADRARTTREANYKVIAEAAALGTTHGIISAPDDVPEVLVEPELSPYISISNGSEATSSEGWSILAWPWQASFRRSGHGAIDTRFLDAETALAACHGGPGTNRFTVVNSSWFDTVDKAPHSVDPRPDFIWLEAPNSSPNESPGWSHWFNWLNQGAYLLPMGPKAWINRVKTTATTPSELQNALIQGDYTATTTPLVTLNVDSTNDYHLIEEVHVSVEGPPGSVERLALVADGAMIAEWTIEALPFTWNGSIRGNPKWLVAMAWSPHGAEWAATPPHWLQEPGSASPQ